MRLPIVCDVAAGGHAWTVFQSRAACVALGWRGRASKPIANDRAALLAMSRRYAFAVNASRAALQFLTWRMMVIRLIRIFVD